MSGEENYIKIYMGEINNVLKNNKYRDTLNGYVQYIVINRKAYSTAYNYLRYVNRFLQETNKNPNELVLSDYVNFLGTMKQKTSMYQVNIYTALKWYSKYLMADKVNLENPMQYINRPNAKESIKTIKRRENKTMTVEQMRDLVEVTENMRDRVICLLLTHTGMRCKGLWKLDVDDIDFKNNKIITVDKGDKVQEYYLDEDTILCIKEWLEDRKRILKDNSTESALFVNNRKRRMSTHAISEVVQKYGREIGMHLTPHVVRSGAITAVYEASKDVFLAQKFAGHSSEKTTELYIRSKENNARKEGARIMSDIFNKRN